MKVCCIGDVVGKPGRQAVSALVPRIKDEYGADFVIVNGENAAAGSGITPRLSRFLLDSGCDLITLGDHVWDQKELEDFLDDSQDIIRPANFPEGSPGRGWTIKACRDQKIAVINILGRTFMRYLVECPFRTIEKILQTVGTKTKIIFVDFHAETTSEKIAMGHFLNGKVTCMTGTHTHVQTADEKILPQGTAYITDLGMTGPHDSVIGQNKDDIIQRFIRVMPVRFHVATDDVRLNGVVVEVDEFSGKAKHIERISLSLPTDQFGKEN